ncbi:MAG TPA: hypothetical protein DDY52_00780 [Candidatus Moranbacteria bacterium]|nr:MAG: hypothetical protein UR51_C0006G0039 [Candidatus Moranbacteria bacterium GW2011_GWF1_34_10]HBI16682.1 hypothetical protein [Candidatus Moranbacteria bacterium]
MSKETAQFNCKEEKGCAGIVVVSTENLVRFGGRGCRGLSPDFYLCDTCGKLHEEDGTPAKNRGGDPFFCINGRIGVRKEDGTMLYF